MGGTFLVIKVLRGNVRTIRTITDLYVQSTMLNKGGSTLKNAQGP